MVLYCQYTCLKRWGIGGKRNWQSFAEKQPMPFLKAAGAHVPTILGALLAALKRSIKWRDQHEPFFRRRKDLSGDFANKMRAGNFPDRHQTLYLCGEPGPGKSCLLNISPNATPPHFPAYLRVRARLPELETLTPDRQLLVWAPHCL